MYPVLYEIGEQAGFCVNCKPFDHGGKRVGYGEVHDIDFMYFPNQYDRDGYIYRQPRVVIEHENAWDLPSKRDDFWKLCLFVSPLRVFIGYCKDQRGAIQQARELTEFYRSHEMTQVPMGEALVLVTWDEIEGKEWVAWVLRGQGNAWQPLGA